MTGYVMAATDARGERLAEGELPTAPTLREAAAFGDSHRTDYVSVRHGHDITLYGRDAAGAWSVLVTDAPAPVVVELRRRHDESCRRGPGRGGGAVPDGVGDPFLPLDLPLASGEDGYVLTAVDVDGEPFGERVSATPPTLEEAAEVGELHEADYVVVSRDDAELVTLYGRDAGGSWSVAAADVDAETAEEVCLWFDLTQHYRGRSPSSAPAGRVGHPLDQVPPPDGGGMPAARATALVAEHVREHRLDYPVQGLAADRFEAGWSVYAPVDVDESDPMAFLDMPVGRSVFLVSDIGRVKETSSSIPPREAEELFGAEEAYVRRRPAEERFLAELKDEVVRRESESEGPPQISSFTVEPPSEEVVAARAAGLLGPLAQQLALLGPAGWDRFTAAFSFTVSREVGQLRFWTGSRSTEVPVPEQIAVLVRRQRHLAARMPAGPWWRLLLELGHEGGANARIATVFDYGDRPLPDGHLLAPEHYRNDLAAYPRAGTPAWLAEYVTGAGGHGTAARTAPQAAAAEGRAGSPRSGAAAPGPGNAPAAQVPPQGRTSPVAPPSRPIPVLDTAIGRKRLYADPQVITYGKRSIALDEVEWVGYSVTHTATKRFLWPTSHESAFDFQVDKYPYHGGLGRDGVLVNFHAFRRVSEPPEEWLSLVNLSRQFLEPRLLAQLVAAVRRGETVTVGAGVKVDRGGVVCARPRVSLPWREVLGTQLRAGMVCVYRKGRDEPVLTVPMGYPNAVLIPDLIAEFMP